MKSCVRQSTAIAVAKMRNTLRMLRRAVRVRATVWVRKNTPGQSAPAQHGFAGLDAGSGRVREDLDQAPEGDQVHEPRCQAAGDVLLPAANAGNEVHGEKGKDADLERLKRPGIAHKDGCGGKDQQQKQAHGHNSRRMPMCCDCRVIQPGIHVYRYDAQCDHCMPRCCFDCKPGLQISEADNSARISKRNSKILSTAQMMARARHKPRALSASIPLFGGN